MGICGTPREPRSALHCLGSNPSPPLADGVTLDKSLILSVLQAAPLPNRDDAQRGTELSACYSVNLVVVLAYRVPPKISLGLILDFAPKD